jgi:hypothetical protein
MYKYDFGLSFAGEDRELAKELARLLKLERIRVFYDHDAEAELWGQDLYQKFQKIYGEECRFFVPFVSANYMKKNWPKHELKQAQARDFKSNVEYILPIRLDDTELPGLNETVGYIDYRRRSILQIAQLCQEKLVQHEPIRRLFLWLRENNPHVVRLLDQKTMTFQLRVAVAKAPYLKEIISSIGADFCNGIDQNNYLMNGGTGPAGCIPSVEAEPHTTFLITLSDGFYDQIGGST